MKPVIFTGFFITILLNCSHTRLFFRKLITLCIKPENVVRLFWVKLFLSNNYSKCTLHQAMSDTLRSYNRQAYHYEKRWEPYLSHTHHEFLQRIKIHDGDKILDPSCGTGLLASELTKNRFPFEKLHLNDLSDKMVAIARERLTDADNITYSQLPADRIAQLNQTFDQIFCLNAFHHYENQQQVLNGFNKLLDQGGKVSILDWNRVGLFRPVNSIIKRFAPEHIDTRSDREMTALLTNAGFRISKTESWAYRYWRFYFIEGIKAD
jgi:ubiquinone/menaquinone biosynthesis C-methylase UbiE